MGGIGTKNKNKLNKIKVKVIFWIYALYIMHCTLCIVHYIILDTLTLYIGIVLMKRICFIVCIVHYIILDTLTLYIGIFLMKRICFIGSENKLLNNNQIVK